MDRISQQLRKSPLEFDGLGTSGLHDAVLEVCDQQRVLLLQKVQRTGGGHGKLFLEIIEGRRIWENSDVPPHSCNDVVSIFSTV